MRADKLAKFAAFSGIKRFAPWVSVFFIALTSATLSATPHCEHKTYSDFIKTNSLSESVLTDPVSLYQHGQFPSVVNAFQDGFAINNDNLTLLFSSLYRLRQICGSQSYLADDPVFKYNELIELLETVFETDELVMLVGLWLENNPLPFSSNSVIESLNHVYSLTSIKKVQTAMLDMGGGINSKLVRQLISTLAELEVSVVVADTDEFNVDNIIDEHLVDIVITDNASITKKRNVDKIFQIGKSSASRWSMSFEKELHQILTKLHQTEPRVTVYSMANIEGIKDIAESFVDFEFKHFNSFAEANSYFSSKVCKKEDKGCVSSLNKQVYLVIGNTQQTVFMNTFLRVAQSVNENHDNEAKVYTTSMATWDGITSVERRDLSNAYIYDAKRLSELGGGYSRDARVMALIRDIITIYEMGSLNVNYSVIPFFGYSGTYYINGDTVQRALDLFRFSELK